MTKFPGRKLPKFRQIQKEEELRVKYYERISSDNKAMAKTKTRPESFLAKTRVNGAIQGLEFCP